MKLINFTYDQIEVGQRASLKRLVTPDDLLVFAAASGNHNPLHLAGASPQDTSPQGRIAPGMYVASLISAVLGNKLPGAGTLYCHQTLDFADRACAGDELVCSVEVTAKIPPRTIEISTIVRRSSDNATIVSGYAQVLAPTQQFESHEHDIPGLIVQRHRHFEALLQRASQLPTLNTAVVCPHDEHSLGGALMAAKQRLIHPILIGCPSRIAQASGKLVESIESFELIEARNDAEAARLACQMVNDGRAVAVMKGLLHTDDLLKPALDKNTGLRSGKRFTHVFVMDVPGLTEPLLVSDAAINIAPDLATKIDICQNAIDLANALGMEPRVGVLSAVETINPAIPSSIDAALLSKMAERGQITGASVDGPLAMDNAVDMGAARTKGLKGAVAGRANILVVPNLDAGNMLAKQLAYISHAEAAGLVLGAKVPIILNSRSDSAMSRLASCAVASIYQQTRGDR